MKAIILKSKSYSMFRLGSGSLEETDNIIHSDTLFSAIINIYSKIYDDTENFIELFQKGSIKISSAFPMLKSENKNIFFLPKPEFSYSADDNFKTAKKVKFISSELVKNNLEQFCFSENATIIGSAFAVSKSEIESKTEIDSFITEIVTPKTKVHYAIQEDNFYHETDIQLIPVSINNKKYYPNFYFLYELNCKKKEYSRFFTCLRILADEGIGGERSTGKGHFEKIIKENIEFESNGNSEKQLLLSLFNPKNQDEFNAVEQYEIIVRGGGSISFDSENEDEEEQIKPYRKKQVRMFAEGAIFNKNVEGRLVDVSPDKKDEHKYFRNGKSFTIPIG